ncbi:holo-ACP synthase [Buchnera aphidicola (Muscaphis stroyani)]|uniref:Holo-[acyl-carrier-protein] synthase n=1 Tax=Buchnera aphidicola (Muscaphis stroyani) TaxID=1241869 RepID=A0A4D6YIR8_9GAMM|nr:holo-ACP synthase [Buchnera aphidicola]QCI24335.1 holo-ACP synthase [Buchnera aphidicola (Muscaphis stroyani)]
MAIIGIGIDSVEVCRIKNIIINFGDKFAQKILSASEWNSYVLIKNKINFIAKRFAVKEAAAKALGTGMNCGITFNQFNLYHNKYGQPKLNFLKNALKQAVIMKCTHIHVSISDSQLFAHASVILES